MMFLLLQTIKMSAISSKPRLTKSSNLNERLYLYSGTSVSTQEDSCYPTHSRFCIPVRWTSLLRSNIFVFKLVLTFLRNSHVSDYLLAPSDMTQQWRKRVPSSLGHQQWRHSDTAVVQRKPLLSGPSTTQYTIVHVCSMNRLHDKPILTARNAISTETGLFLGWILKLDSQQSHFNLKLMQGQWIEIHK